MGNTRAVRRHLALALVAGVVTAAAGAALAPTETSNPLSAWLYVRPVRPP